MHFTTKQISKELQLSEETIRRWIRQGKLVATKIGRKQLIHNSEYQRFLTERGIRTTSSNLIQKEVNQVMYLLSHISDAALDAAIAQMELELHELQELQKHQGA